MPLEVGLHLGHYEILSPLGAGGMGEVYRARDERLGREVAIKVLPASFANDADRLRRFEQEARATSALNHPNILTVREVALAIGRLGGHMNRKADGMPGWLTLLRGMTKLNDLAEGARIAFKLKGFG